MKPIDLRVILVHPGGDEVFSSPSSRGQRPLLVDKQFDVEKSDLRSYFQVYTGIIQFFPLFFLVIFSRKRCERVLSKNVFIVDHSKMMLIADHQPLTTAR